MNLVNITVDMTTYQEIIKLMQRAEKNREQVKRRYREKVNSEGYTKSEQMKVFYVTPVNPLQIPLYNNNPQLEIINQSVC